MNVFRLSLSKYSRDLSGLGAEKSGGRWNSRGAPMVYTSASRALCTAELAVHLPLGIIPHAYQLVTLEIQDRLIDVLDLNVLPSDWNSLPHADATQKVGDHFVSEGKSLALKVPSAVVPGDFNFLINPGHKKMGLIRIIDIRDYDFDKRLFVR
jgi:RES domain-containing protein